MSNKKEIVSKKGLENIAKSLEKLDKAKQDIAKSLLNEIEFCTKTLAELKAYVNVYGVIVEMPQGDYSIERENPALKSYNTTIKNYQNLMKQLSDLFTNIPPEDKPDELEEFCK